jgi:hypothetical protein
MTIAAKLSDHGLLPPDQGKPRPVIQYPIHKRSQGFELMHDVHGLGTQKA